MARYARFEPETLRFLEELAVNNNRDWFAENKSRYEEQVLDVALRFIQSMQDPLHEIAPCFVALPTRVGGSLMRVYRDTRFSKNKLPYKTNIGIQFRHEQAKDVHAPGYYVHRMRSSSGSVCGVPIRAHSALYETVSWPGPPSGSVHRVTRPSGAISSSAASR